MVDVTTLSFSVPYSVLTLIVFFLLGWMYRGKPLPASIARPRAREVALSLGAYSISVAATAIAHAFVPYSFWNFFGQPSNTFEIVISLFGILLVFGSMPLISGGYRSLRLTTSNWEYSAVLAIIASIIAVVPMVLGGPRLLFDAVSKSSGFDLLLLITVALVSAFSQELLFRGLLQTRFEGLSGTWIGLIITAVLFGLWHGPGLVIAFGYSLWDIIQYTLFSLPRSLVFGYIAYRSNSLVGSISFHFVLLIPYSLLLPYA